MARRHSWPPASSVSTAADTSDYKIHLGIYEFRHGESAGVYKNNLDLFRKVTNSVQNVPSFYSNGAARERDEEGDSAVSVTDGFMNCSHKSGGDQVVGGSNDLAAAMVVPGAAVVVLRPALCPSRSVMRRGVYSREGQVKKVVTLWHNYYPEGQWGWIVVCVAATINCLLHGFQFLVALTVIPPAAGNKGGGVAGTRSQFVVALDTKYGEVLNMKVTFPTVTFLAAVVVVSECNPLLGSIPIFGQKAPQNLQAVPGTAVPQIPSGASPGVGHGNPQVLQGLSGVGQIPHGLAGTMSRSIGQVTHGLPILGSMFNHGGPPAEGTNVGPSKVQVPQGVSGAGSRSLGQVTHGLPILGSMFSHGEPPAEATATNVEESMVRVPQGVSGAGSRSISEFHEDLPVVGDGSVPQQVTHGVPVVGSATSKLQHGVPAVGNGLPQLPQGLPTSQLSTSKVGSNVVGAVPHVHPAQHVVQNVHVPEVGHQLGHHPLPQHPLIDHLTQPHHHEPDKHKGPKAGGPGKHHPHHHSAEHDHPHPASPKSKAKPLKHHGHSHEHSGEHHPHPNKLLPKHKKPPKHHGHSHEHSGEHHHPHPKHNKKSPKHGHGSHEDHSKHPHPHPTKHPKPKHPPPHKHTTSSPQFPFAWDEQGNAPSKRRRRRQVQQINNGGILRSLYGSAPSSRSVQSYRPNPPQQATGSNLYQATGLNLQQQPTRSNPYQPIGSNSYPVVGSNSYHTTGSNLYQTSGSNLHQATGSSHYQAAGSNHYQATGPSHYQATGSSHYHATAPNAYQATGSSSYQTTESTRQYATGSSFYQPAGSNSYQTTESSRHYSIASTFNQPTGYTPNHATGSSLLPSANSRRIPKTNDEHETDVRKLVGLDHHSHLLDPTPTKQHPVPNLPYFPSNSQRTLSQDHDHHTDSFLSTASQPLQPTFNLLDFHNQQMQFHQNLIQNILDEHEKITQGALQPFNTLQLPSLNLPSLISPESLLNPYENLDNFGPPTHVMHLTELKPWEDYSKPQKKFHHKSHKKHHHHGHKNGTNVSRHGNKVLLSHVLYDNEGGRNRTVISTDEKNHKSTRLETIDQHHGDSHFKILLHRTELHS